MVFCKKGVPISQKSKNEILVTTFSEKIGALSVNELVKNIDVYFYIMFKYFNDTLYQIINMPIILPNLSFQRYHF